MTDSPAFPMRYAPGSATKVTQSNAFAAFFCFVILEIFCFINSFVVNLKGATVDAEEFHARAVQWVETGTFRFVTNADFFDQYLGIIYWVIYPSEFIGAQFGLLAMFASWVYLMRIARVLQVSWPDWGTYAFLLWPSLLLRVTTTMREPYLILSIILVCYYLLMFKNTHKVSDFVRCMFFCLVGFFFHKAYALFLPILVIYASFFVIKPSKVWYKSQIFYVRMGIVLFCVGGLWYISQNLTSVRGLGPLLAALNGDLDYINTVLSSKAGREFRTTYDVTLDFSSPLALAQSVPMVVIYYMFYPFPWKVVNAYDLIASVEGLLRFAALAILTKYLFIRRRFPGEMRKVFVIVAVLCVIWAGGTANYGTGSRHHITTNWFWVLTFVMYFAYRRNMRVAR